MPTDGKLRIIEAARIVISKSGIAGATMRSIAEEAGLSTGAIYHYYRCKEEVLYDVMDTSLSESIRIAAETQHSEKSKAAIIEEIYENIKKRFSKNDENRIQFYLAQEAILGNQELREKFQNKYKEWVESTEQLMKYLYGVRPSRYNKAFASLLLGAIDGMVMQLLLNSNPADKEAAAEVYRHILETGIPKFLEYLLAVEEK